MFELAFTHLGYFLKVASEKLIFCVFGFFLFCSGAAVVVLKLAFVAFPCFKWCFNKALVGQVAVLSVLAFSRACFCYQFYTVGVWLASPVWTVGFHLSCLCVLCLCIYLMLI